MKLNSRSGFSALETLIVIVIISILGAIFIPKFNNKNLEYNKEQCTAMFNLAHDLRDSIKVVKIREGCLVYVHTP